MERSPTRDFIVGLFVLVGLGAMAYLSVSVGGFTWGSRGGLKLTARFNEIGGLSVRAPVVIAGVRIGEVTDIRLDQQNFRAIVEMNLNRDLKLSTDTIASIVSSGIIGDRYITLAPGADDKMLKSGDEITSTESAMILERLLGQIVYGVTKDDKKGGAATGPATAPASGP